MRIDRFLTLNFFHPLKKALPASGGIRIPILMYHSISDEPESGHPYFWLNTSPARFAEQMRYLKEHDYTVISLSEAVERLQPAPTRQRASADRLASGPGYGSAKAPRLPESPNRTSPPRRFAVITFDDGYADFRTCAWPVLQKYGFGATVFLPTGYISDRGRTFKGKNCMCWSEIRELVASGISFGTHTVTHAKLRDLGWDQVEREIRESTNALEVNLGARAKGFSYPYAFPEEDDRFTARLRSLLVELQYENGVTTSVGTAAPGHDRFLLKRIPVSSADDPVLFRAKLEDAYDWVHGLQYAKKLLTRRMGAGAAATRLSACRDGNA